MGSTIVLDSEKSYRAVENAIRTQAQLVLTFPDLNNITVRGFLVSGDNSALLAEVTGRFPNDEATILETPCEVTMSGDRQYLFTSRITAIPKWGDSRSIALARPKLVQVSERRRFFRAKLAPSTQVDVEWTADNTTHRHKGALCNISPDGLACRLDVDAAKDLAGTDRVHTSFTLPGRDEPFQLPATIHNRTPASGGAVIFGLQFIHSSRTDMEFEALRQLLERSDRYKTESKVSV